MRRNKLDTSLALAVPARMIDEIDAVADREMCSRSVLVRKAITEHLKKYQAVPNLAEHAA